MPKEKGDLSRHQDLRSSLTPVLTLRLKQGAHTVLSHRREPKQAELAGRVFQIFKCLLNYYLSFNSNPWRLIFLHLLKEIKKKNARTHSSLGFTLKCTPHWMIHSLLRFTILSVF